jgi:hypothetical protein
MVSWDLEGWVTVAGDEDEEAAKRWWEGDGLEELILRA